ncbi:MAG: hypothetical protein AAF600_08235 [Bacteroidota bacterium]
MLRLDGHLTVQSGNESIEIINKGQDLLIKFSDWSVFFNLLSGLKKFNVPLLNFKKQSLHINQLINIKIDQSIIFKIDKGKVSGYSFSTAFKLISYFIRSLFR